MKKGPLGLLLILAASLSAGVAQNSNAIPPETKAQRDARITWWRDARFGMFIHWGLYALPAGAWHGQPVSGNGEWIMNKAQISVADYAALTSQFNPVKFKATSWVRIAKAAGMKYIIITAKHHDGFAMFNSAASPFNLVAATPFHRDPLKELAAACAVEDLRLGFYYSQSQDWHHRGGAGNFWDASQAGDFDAYLDAVAVPQVRELLSNYGPISMLWYDTPRRMTEERAAKFLPLHALQPGIIVNNRLRTPDPRDGSTIGDTETPEQYVPPNGYPGKDWETCMTMNDHWGYNKADKNFKSTKEIIRMLADIASKGGNYLLNVGPTAEGLFPQESIDRLAAIGKWMKVNGESIYGTQASPFKELSWGRCTRKTAGDRTILYLHVFDWPSAGKLVLSGMMNTPEKAYLLADLQRMPLKTERDNDALVISLPKDAPDPINSVLVLELKGKLDLTEPPVFTTEFDTFVDSLPIAITTNRENVEVRFNIGPTEPSASSALYSKPIGIKTTTTINARCFRQGLPVSGTITREFRKVDPVRAQYPDRVMYPGLRYSYYEGAWDSLPDFNKLTPLQEGIVPDFIVTPRSQDERFGFVYSGFVLIPETSVYIFYTGSDDGSRLYIDDFPVVNNDGLHSMAEKSGTIALAKGYHRIRVAYFEQTGSDNLVVLLKGQTLPKQVLPQNWLFFN